jgi:hypothetical protein
MEASATVELLMLLVAWPGPAACNLTQRHGAGNPMSHEERQVTHKRTRKRSLTNANTQIEHGGLDATQVASQ